MNHLRSVYRSRGFSLAEVMVGIAIAVIAALVIMQVFTLFEGQKRTTTSGADTVTDGAIATFTIERDVRMAGYGMSLPAALGCKVNSQYDGTNRDFKLAPVTITNGANGAPDKIQVLSSSKKGWSVPARITTDHPPEATNMFLNTIRGVEVNDLMVAFEPGKDCTLLQVTGIPNGNVQIHHQNTSPWNPPGGQNIFPDPDGYKAGSTLFNLGAMLDHTYAVTTAGNLELDDFQTATNTSTVRSLASNVVTLQAEYGFDTRAGNPTDARVDHWDADMYDADGSGVVGDNGDIRRIYAVRMAIVARSPIKEKPGTDGTCYVTQNKPTWAGGELDISKNPDGSDNADWKCYRYKVFETVVPLRNVLWRDS